MNALRHPTIPPQLHHATPHLLIIPRQGKHQARATPFRVATRRRKFKTLIFEAILFWNIEKDKRLEPIYFYTIIHWWY